MAHPYYYFCPSILQQHARNFVAFELLASGFGPFFFQPRKAGAVHGLFALGGFFGERLGAAEQVLGFALARSSRCLASFSSSKAPTCTSQPLRLTAGSTAAATGTGMDLLTDATFAGSVPRMPGFARVAARPQTLGVAAIAVAEAAAIAGELIHSSRC